MVRTASFALGLLSVPRCIAVPPTYDLQGPIPIIMGNTTLQLVALVNGVRSTSEVEYLEWCTYGFELYENGRISEPILRTGSEV